MYLRKVSGVFAFIFLWNTVKTRIKEHVFWAFRLILFLYIGCFLQNQPENVLKVFLKLVLKIKYCIDYQQMESTCKHNILINGWMDPTLTALIKAIILHWGRGSSSGDKQLKWPSHLGATSDFGLRNEIALSVIVYKVLL